MAGGSYARCGSSYRRVPIGACLANRRTGGSRQGSRSTCRGLPTSDLTIKRSKIRSRNSHKPRRLAVMAEHRAS